jgi:hypothetical protein
MNSIGLVSPVQVRIGHLSTILLIVILILSIHPSATSPVKNFYTYDWEILNAIDPSKDFVREAFLKLTSNDRCDIPVVHHMSPRVFREKYWNKSPFILRGGASSWPGGKKWTKEYLISSFGDIDVQIGTSQNIIRNTGTGNKVINFGEYVESVWGVKDCKEDQRWCDEQYNHSKNGDAKYLFDRDNFMQQAIRKDPIFNDMVVPYWFQAVSEVTSAFYEKEFKELWQVQDEDNAVASSTEYIFLTPKYNRLVGVALHQHTDGWNAQVAGNGVKLWIIYPQQVKTATKADQGISWCCGEDSWLRKYVPGILSDRSYGPGNRKPLFCTQQSGDVVYIPEWWAHGTISGPGPTGKSGIVGVAGQLKSCSGNLRLNYQGRYLLDLARILLARLRRKQPTNDRWYNSDVGKYISDGSNGRIEETEYVIESALKMLRDHFNSDNTLGITSGELLLKHSMEELEKLTIKARSNNQTIVYNETKEYKEAKELAKKCLKYYGSYSSASEHLARLALMNNESQEAFLHIRNGK